jgi:peroxiredoxin
MTGHDEDLEARRRSRGVGGLLVAMAGVAALVLWSELRGPTGARPGATAAEFELPRLGGGAVRLSSFRGRPTLLDFWATWCAPCEDELLTLQQLQADSAAQGTSTPAIVGINIDGGDTSTEEVMRFVQRLGVTFPVALDTGGVATTFGVTRIPLVVLVDGQGRIVQTWSGRVAATELMAAVQRVVPGGLPAR